MENFDRLSYAPEAGLFTWVKPTSNRISVGDVAGSDDGKGYFVIRYNGKPYKAHRIAWFLTYGVWPDGEIDHINGNRSDNRIANLRDVSNSINQQNQRRPSSGNSSGFLGVSWNKAEGKWRAQIQTNGKTKHLGYFDDPSIAHEAYLTAKRNMHEGCTI